MIAYRNVAFGKVKRAAIGIPPLHRSNHAVETVAAEVFRFAGAFFSLLRHKLHSVQINLYLNLVIDLLQHLTEPALELAAVADVGH